ncbi:MAG: Methyltransferase type 11 [Hyphomicrobiales bacterium]|nr:Methyltransferase type 11 [Hyphomicrobiales bacterium]
MTHDRHEIDSRELAPDGLLGNERLHDYSKEPPGCEDLVARIEGLNKRLGEVQLLVERITEDLSIHGGGGRLALDFRIEATRSKVAQCSVELENISSSCKQGLVARIRDNFTSFRAGMSAARKKRRKKHDNKQASKDLSRIDFFGHEFTSILTTQHCTYVAELISASLLSIGVKSEIIFSEPDGGFSDGPHFVICPQMFEKLPGLYIAYQMEQSVSSRWFSPEYFSQLENAFAIFDYSIDNIKFLTSRGLHAKQIYYMPISHLATFRRKTKRPQKPMFDVLFYGDPNSPRRRSILEELQKNFAVKIVSEVFGDELYDLIERAKIIVNIHYYDNALLETTRLYECLSLGKVIVSEKGSDRAGAGELEGIVQFVETGDVEALVGALSSLLADKAALKARETVIAEFVSQRVNGFQFHFMRFLLAAGVITFDEFYRQAGSYVTFTGERVCLSLPEYVDRQADFKADDRFGFQVFTGLRHSIGWIGCGLSYKFIMRKALEQKMARIVVCEDDVLFYEDWEKRFDEVCRYLDTMNDWDVFCGLIADLHKETGVRQIDHFDTERFIHLDRMTSMVFNVYNKKFFKLMAAWDETLVEVETNTIDRYIETSANLQIVTTLPYLVGHKEDLYSTLWNSKNDQYNPMICGSIDRLAKLVGEYEGSRHEARRLEHT